MLNKKSKKILSLLISIIIVGLGIIFFIYLSPINTSFKNTKCVTYGDSITQMGGWQKIINKRIGFKEIYNKGIGSTSYTKNDLYAYLDFEGNYVSRSNVVDTQPNDTQSIESWLYSMERIKTIPYDADIVLLMAGTNDCYQNVEIGNISDELPDTFIGAVKLTVNNLKEYLGNDAIIVLISPLSGNEDIWGNNGKNYAGYSMEDYANSIELVANELDVPFIDIYNDTLIKDWNKSIFIKDEQNAKVHPNILGKIEISRVISNGLKKIQVQ